jgi:hypothetical protein
MEKGSVTPYWMPESILVDDKHVALTISYGHSYSPLYIVNITEADSIPKSVTLPGVRENVEETTLAISHKHTCISSRTRLVISRALPLTTP